MAQKVEEAEGIIIDAAYLNGKLQNENTKCGTHINQDVVQYHQKIMANAGIGANGFDDNEVNGYQFVEASLEYFNAGLNHKVIPTGVWNMNGTPQLLVNHGLTTAEIASIKKYSCIIYNDIAGIYTQVFPFNFESTDAGFVVNGAIGFSSTQVVLTRNGVGQFAVPTLFAGAVNNRGYILIEYKKD